MTYDRKAYASMTVYLHWQDPKGSFLCLHVRQFLYSIQTLTVLRIAGDMWFCIFIDSIGAWTILQVKVIASTFTSIEYVTFLKKNHRIIFYMRMIYFHTAKL